MSRTLRIVVLLLILIQMLLAIYLPINNIIEYWTHKTEWPSLHFFIFSFSAFAFYALLGLQHWKSLSPIGRKMAITACIGWATDLYLICINPYLNTKESIEPYIIGLMVIVAPCAIYVIDFMIQRIQRGKK